MKKLDAKSWIIIGTSAAIMAGVVGLSYYNLKKAEADVKTVEDHNYANQSTVVTEATQPSETTNPYVDPMISEYLSTFDNTAIDPEYEAQVDGDYQVEYRGDGEDVDDTLYFNIVEDTNYDNSLIDMDTISIDGHIIDFPSTYATITNTFGELHSAQFEDYLPTDIVSGEIIVGCEGTTGVGRIDFVFTSDGESKQLSECRCIGVQLSTFNYDSEAQNMTISLPGNVHFGDVYDDVRSKFPVLYDESNSSGGQWCLVFEDQGISYTLFGGSEMNMAMISFE